MSDELETIQYLTFTMADELVVVDGARVLEILELADFANETQLPEFMQGIISLRGCPVPVINLLLKFTIQESVQSVSTFNIAVELMKDGENVILQAPTDNIRKSIQMNHSQLDAAPHWLRCRFSKNDLNILSKIFIHAATSPGIPSDEGLFQPL